jgi:hypothetical protein
MAEPLPDFTYDEFLEHVAANRRLTIDGMLRWLSENGLVIRPCHCEEKSFVKGDAGCRGWKVTTPDDDT